MRRPRRVPRPYCPRDSASPFQPPLCESEIGFPTAQFLLPSGVVAFPANDIELCASLWRAIQGDAA